MKAKLLLFLLLVYFIFLRFQLGTVRYFNVDEFAHLHWGYSLLAGEKPYTDFFYLFPPFFLYPVAAIFFLFGRTVNAIAAVRLFIFLVFLANLLLVFLLGKKLRNIFVGLLAAFIFVILPIPADNMVEVRPDNLATLFSLSGLYLFMLGLEKRKKQYFFLSGLSFAGSLGFVPKTVFFLIPPLLVLILFPLRILLRSAMAFLRTSQTRSTPPAPRDSWCSRPWACSKSMASPQNSYSPRSHHPLQLIYVFLLGFIPPLLLLIFLLVSYGKPLFAIYSMMEVSAATTKVLASKFYMRPDIFFYPNSIYYGTGGFSPPYLMNLVIYISASIFAIVRFISFKNSKEFLLGASFFTNLFAYVAIFPLKHAQYLIPIVPFIAFYFADLLESITNKFLKSLKYLKVVVGVGMLLILALVSNQMYGRKIQLGNKSTFDKINIMLSTIPAKAPVFDLTGETVFFRDGYYFCCLPYGQYIEGIFFNIPDLEKDFNRRNTEYVYVGDGGDRLSKIPPYQAKYIKENFINLIPDGSLLIKK